jgi:hypothetical protein
MGSLADLGHWPSIEVRSHSVIRHAYENVLNACARLASFATGGPTTTDGPISEQQEILAVDDLVTFAIHARRLIENTDSQNRFRRVTLRLNPKGPVGVIAITRVINVLVHHKQMEIVRDMFQLEMASGQSNVYEIMARYGTEATRQHNKNFSPVVFIKSENSPTISFDILEMVETF